MKSKIFITLIILLTYYEIIQGQGAWTRKTDFGGVARYNAVGFSIGAKGYIGTGGEGTYYKDFWEFDPATNTWTQKADYGGLSIGSAVGFSIGTKGYIGTGYYGLLHQDFWEWDQATNVWTQKANFGGIARWYATGFSIDNKGYIGLGDGYNPQYNHDFWEYDPSNDTWTQKADFGGGGRIWTPGFSIGGKGYVGTGNNNAYYNDFWEYDPLTNIWTQKANYGGAPMESAVGFSLGTKGYIGTGVGGNPYNRYDFWEYNPITDAWIQIADFGGTGRCGAVAFSFGGKGYVGTGRDGVIGYTKDFWEYDPCKASISGDFKICQGDSTVLTANSGNSYLWSTGETTQSIVVSLAGNYSVTVFQSISCSTTTTSNITSVSYITPKASINYYNFCEGDSIFFSPLLTCIKDTSWLWNFGDTVSGALNKSNIKNPSHVFSSSGNFHVTLIVNGVDTAKQTLGISSLPTVNLGNDTALKQGDTLVLDAGYVSWQFGSYLWSTGATDQTINVTDTGTYYVKVCLMQCCASDSIHIGLFVGIDEITKSQNPVISPNPFCDHLNIVVNENEQIEIILYDIFSKKLIAKTFTHSTIINTAQLANGIYIYEMRSKSRLIRKGKIVKD